MTGKPGSWMSIPTSAGSLVLLTPEQGRWLDEERDQRSLLVTSKAIMGQIESARRAEAAALVAEPEVELALQLIPRLRLAGEYAHRLIEFALTLTIQRMPRKPPEGA